MNRHSACATAALLVAVGSSHGEKPTVIEGSAVDTSVDPASVTYTPRDKNIYGQPMEVLVPKAFQTDEGLSRRCTATSQRQCQVSAGPNARSNLYR